MPKLKSILAGLAVSTAMGGGLVGLSAATATSADAATSIGAATSTAVQAGCFRRLRCGGWGNGWGNGWGWRRHHNRVGKVKVKIHNRNFNRNRPTVTTVTPVVPDDHDRRDRRDRD